jgi:ABC-type branched-subunit amino acid transport system permease subunit
VVIGLPALRVRGINLAIVTLTLAFAANSLLFQNQAIEQKVAPHPVDPVRFSEAAS